MPDPAVRRFLLAGAVIPVTVSVVGVGLQVWALPDLPDPVARHWGLDGHPDGFGSPTSSVLLSGALGLGLPALLAGSALPGLRRGDRGASYRLMAAASAGTTTFLLVLMTTLLLAQRGLPDAAAADTVFAPLGGAAVAGLVLGWLGWRVQPAAPERRATWRPAVPTDAGGESSWSREVVASPVALTLLVAGTLATAGLAVGAWLFADREAVWVLGATTVLLVTALAATAAFHVRVDADGLTVRSVAGVPWFRVPLEDVEEVGVARINPVGEFGGWGVRWVPGRLGLVLRAGEAIVVSRRGRSQFVVTVDDAETGAAVLAALAARQHRDS